MFKKSNGFQIGARVKKLYLSGGMTGIKDLNKPAFFKAARLLRRHGFRVVNPTELDWKEPKRSWVGCLERDIAHLVTCEAIATLPGWKKSKGANLEIYIGKALSYPVHSVAYWLKRRIR